MGEQFNNVFLQLTKPKRVITDHSTPNSHTEGLPTLPKSTRNKSTSVFVLDMRLQKNLTMERMKKDREKREQKGRRKNIDRKGELTVKI